MAHSFKFLSGRRPTWPTLPRFRACKTHLVGSVIIAMVPPYRTLEHEHSEVLTRTAAINVSSTSTSFIMDHSRSGVVYNFGGGCYVYLAAYDNFRKP